MIKWLTFVSLISLFATANCDEYKRMKVEDIAVDFFNVSILDESTFEMSVNYKTDGLNTVDFILDIIEDIREDLIVKLKVFGQAFGAYKVPTGISFDMNICHSTVSEYFFKQVFEDIGWLNNCPPTKGKYRLIDYNLSETLKLPMPVPSGFRVLLDVDIHTKSVSILTGKGYLKVV